MSIQPGSFRQELPAERLQSLLNLWERLARNLMHRDGNDPAFTDGGHRIKNNPVLVAAINEIRDGYFQLFYEKTQLLKLIPDASEEGLQQALEDIEYDLIYHNHQSYMRLQEDGYGFTPEEAERLLHASGSQAPDAPTRLARQDAGKILGTVIGRAIDSFHIALRRDGIDRMRVPHLPLAKHPAASGRSCSRPLPDDLAGWRERLHSSEAQHVFLR